MLRELRDRGTIAATAGVLHLTPFAVSQQLATLSREVGVRLLVRQGRGVRLTPEAGLLLEHAAVLQARLERARAELTDLAAGELGHLRIGAFGSAIVNLVAPSLRRLHEERPRLTVSVRESDPPNCFTLLDASNLDLVITVDYRGGPTRVDVRYHRIDLLSDPYDVAMPIRHRRAGAEKIELSDLATEPWILGAESGPCGEIAFAACNAAGFNPDIRHRVNDWNAVLALVAGTGGVALIPRLAATNVPDGVILCEVARTAPARRIYAAVRAGAEHGVSIASMLTCLRDTAAQKII
ncbi:LysR family transcriptional regulator [Nonomuraea rosea]|uniref:LysR family transcriptional regulator n=1 Tax=Nonomuraea rosea TaxID=638574 RepID=UPI0031EC6058